MNNIYIVRRVDTGKECAELRAYATADGAHQKMEKILESVLGWTPTTLHCTVKTLRTPDGKLYAIETSETKWNIKTMELIP